MTRRRVACAFSLCLAFVLAGEQRSIAAASAGRASEARWYGFWEFADFRPGVMKAGIIPFAPPYEDRIREINRIADAGGDVPTVSKRCLPFGMPFGMEAFTEIYFGPSHATIVMGGGVRCIWTDGRAHTPEDLLFESLNGESIGHWERDSFVIDTIGIQANEIVLGVPVPNMRVVERLRLAGPDQLDIVTTVTAPGALSAPWVHTRHYRRSPNGPGRFALLGQQGCSGDRSVDPATGIQGFDLTPPAGGFVPPGAH